MGETHGRKWNRGSNRNCRAAPCRTVTGVNVKLHYIEEGSGPPVVFVHGGLQDYRQWLPQVDRFARDYRVIVYSRRYNYPNLNRPIETGHSALVDAHDLAGLLLDLHAAPAHLIGHSYGALGALFTALEYPHLVRSLVLAEPPVLRWLLDVPEHKHLFDEMMTAVRDPVIEAFKRGDAKTALQIMVEYFIDPKTKFERLSQFVQSMFNENVAEWEALMTSPDAFPDIPRNRMRNLPIPLLLFTGDRTLPIHRAVNDEFEKLIPPGRRVTFTNCGHNMWADRQTECEDLTLEFLNKPRI
jgi:pimeloyl-ACP methyl ester carboxylesterase